MEDFTTEELKEILETMHFSSENLDRAYDKIETELSRRKKKHIDDNNFMIVLDDLTGVC